MAIKKASATPAPKASAAATNTKKVVFEPLPGTVAAAVEGNAKPQKLYINLNNKEYRVNQCTLHKGTPDEVSFSFINVWDDNYSVSITNPTVSQIREIQSTYTRVRGFNVVKFGSKITVYRMRPLEDSELSTAYEK